MSEGVLSRLLAVAGALLVLLQLAGWPAAAEEGDEDPAGVPAALPGAPPFPSALRERLGLELASRPASDPARTRHRHGDGSPLFTNRLLLAASPYLQQHAHNPVNWYPWGDEAFEAARRLGRPLLVSIGYATCHWCHVMEEESFDDVATATYLNEHFIAVKVDREARPDVDAIYMAALHAMGQRGGWPLNVWLTPTGKPFFGGTYFPPAARGDRAGFRQVLERVQQEYALNREGIDAIADSLAATLRADLEGPRADASHVPGPETLALAMQQTAANVDPRWGGMGRGTKFPSSTPLRAMLRYAVRNGDEEVLRLATLTLEKMAQGGIHDHVGGGFHRYSTDPAWLVPHFEKMLYDNALLAITYLEAGQLMGRADFVEVTRGILDYVAREMTSPGGAFYSATDADSRDGKGELEEGLFFTWTPDEIATVLGKGGDGLRAVLAYYDVTPAGDLAGRNILHAGRERADVAAELEMDPSRLDALLVRAREQLYAARARRSPPLRDEKILAAWNGLMISAFARAGLVLGEPDYVARAAAAADFVLTRMRDEGRLHRVHLAGRSRGPAFLDDYAFFIAGLLDLYEASGQPRWLREALALQAVQDTYHADDDGGGYYQTAADHEALLAREKPSEEGATPSGNAVAASNLLRLTELTGNDAFQQRAVGIFSVFHDSLSSRPLAFSEMLVALDFFWSERVEVVLLSPGDGRGLEAMLAQFRATFLPARVFLHASEADALADHAKLSPLLRGRRARGGTTTAYLCRNRVCGFPTEDPTIFAEQLRDAIGLPTPRVFD